MAFIAITQDNRHFQWGINEGKPARKPIEAVLDPIVFLQADGEELVYIISIFMNVPYVYGLCMWRNSMAQFIFDNLQQKPNYEPKRK